MILTNASTEIKNYSREELILPQGIILASIWNLVIRDILPYAFYIFLFTGYTNYFLLVLFIVRGVLDIMLVFGARNVLNRLKMGGYICLIGIILIIIIDVWFFVLISENSISLILWLLILGIPFVYQINGSIKSFRESLEL